MIKLGLAGCGRISRKHVESFIELSENIALTHVCDVKNDRAERLAKEYSETGKTKPYICNSYEHLLAAAKEGIIDLIVLCTPSGLHASQAIGAARLGVSVVTEKPMATRWPDAIEMIREFDKSTASLYVVKQNRFNPTIQLLKGKIDRKMFGRINYISCNVFWCRPQSYYDNDTWRGTWEFDGGAVMNQASHYVDLLQWLGGPIQSVQAISSTRDRNIEVENNCTANIAWRNGAIGSLAISMMAPFRNTEGSIQIIGDNGIAKIGGVALNRVDEWEFKDGTEDIDVARATSYESSSVYGNGHRWYYEKLVESIVKKEALAGREGLASLEVIIAIYKAARDRKIISLPLES